MTHLKSLLVLTAALMASPLGAFTNPKEVLQVVTTLPELAWLAQEVGGTHVAVSSLLSGGVNAHHVDARPDYILKVANADVFCQVGMGLEIGWLPKVLDKAASAKVTRGHPGFCDGSLYVTKLEVPEHPVNRSMGDVHPEGNPHYWLSPLEMMQSAKSVLESLQGTAPGLAHIFQAGYQKVIQTLKDLHQQGVKVLRPYTHLRLMEYHKEFGYFLRAYGFPSAEPLEEIPGIAPSAARIASASHAANKLGVRVLLAAPFAPPGILKKFKDLSQIPVLTLSTQMTREDLSAGYPQFHEILVRELVKSLANSPKPESSPGS
jgi:zinc/manganese transport system substrate-binding protein